MKLLKDKRGMTLFELLAVIVILGIVAAIAYPTVTTLINNQKRNAFVEQANMFVNNAITLARADLQEPDGELDVTTYYFGTDFGDTGFEIDRDDSTQQSLDNDFSGNFNAYIVLGKSGNDVIVIEFYYADDNYSITKVEKTEGYTIPFTKNDIDK